MVDIDAIHQRGRALEDEFFHRVDEKLREQLRTSMEHEEARKTLAATTGFEDEALLEHLVEAGFVSTTLAALGLVPVVFVAWADGKVTTEERQAVMGEALHRGLESQPTAFDLVEGWLEKRPRKELWDLWVDYLHAVLQHSSSELGERLQKSVMQQATMVAKSSAGILGIIRVGKEEQEVLERIENAFSVD